MRKSGNNAQSLSEQASQARVAELEEKLAAIESELAVTNEGVLALYAGLDEARAELTERNRLLQEADRNKGEFLANMSHEIRTPMNAILGLTEALLLAPANPGQRESLCVIREAGQGLLTLINDILDFSKIEACMLELEIADFAPATLFETSLELLRGLAQQKKLDLLLRVAPEVPPFLRGDRHRLRQILLNLVGNAIKFSQLGEILIRVTAGEPNGITVTVRDTGPGISAQAQAKLFQPFVQEKESITFQHGGTGLGLSISRRLVELMGGEIWVESVLGEGSTFAFRVPLEEGSAPVLPAAVDGGQQSRLAGRVLVADDHPANHLVARYQLELLGLKVDFVKNGREAVAAVQSQSYDLVLMDCHMPEMDGYQATREIRRAEQVTGERIPIIAMTAGALSGDRDKCLQAGMDDHVSKPVEVASLGKVLSTWLGYAQAAGPKSEPTATTDLLIDIQALENIYGAESMLELGGLFQQDAGRAVAKLLQALTQHDLAGVDRHGHGLRGLCGTLRLATMVAQCELLRQAQVCQDWIAIEHWIGILATDFEGVIHQLNGRYPSLTLSASQAEPSLPVFSQQPESVGARPL